MGACAGCSTRISVLRVYNCFVGSGTRDLIVFLVLIVSDHSLSSVGSCHEFLTLFESYCWLTLDFPELAG
jgi:hypothetical protein